MQRKPFFAGIIGNILEHYDTALFGLLAPFIAPLFFHDQTPLTGLILTYALLPLGFIARPFGSFCFGRIADHFGRRQALCFSLLGMAMATFSIGLLPTSRAIGALSPLLLAFLRLLQSFFAAGETAGGAVYVLEHTDPQKRSFMSSLFDASTIAGILIASFLVTLLSSLNCIETAWRFLFFAGGISALFGLLLRFQTTESAEFISDSTPPSWRNYKRPFFRLILASGFSYTTYAFPFILMNGYVPLITSLTKTDVMKMNTLLLVLDLFLLPIFGSLAHRFGKEKIMFLGALSACIGIFPLFSLLNASSTLFSVTLLRSFIVLCGIAFSAPYHAWAIEQVPPHCRSTLLCLSYSIGAQVIGAPTPTLSLWLYEKTGWTAAPSLVLLPIALAAIWALPKLQKKPLSI